MSKKPPVNGTVVLDPASPIAGEVLDARPGEPTPLPEPEGGWPPDEFTGIGGSYVRDPFTGVRSRVVPDPTDPINPDAAASDE